MARMVGPDDTMVSVTVNRTDGVRKTLDRDRDGTFHVNEKDKRFLKATGDFADVSTNFGRLSGYVCNGCGFASLYRDHCGRCDGTDLRPE